MKKITLVMFIIAIIVGASLQTLALSGGSLEDEICAEEHMIYLKDVKLSYKQPVAQEDYCYKISDIYYYGCIDCSHVITKEQNVFKKHSHNADSNRICEDCAIRVR